MQRYFGQIVGKNAVLIDSDQHHLLKVMRAHPGDVIEVVNEGDVYVCQVESIKPLKIRVARKLKEDHEIHVNVILACALLKGDKLDYVIQKTCELGVSEIVFLKTKRTITKINVLEREAKFNRFRRIAKEACEQSKRSAIPLITRLIDFNQIDSLMAKYRLIANVDEDGGSATTSFLQVANKLKNGDSVVILIGPEGGFDVDEIALAKRLGFKDISLGKRILRAETASITVIGVISSILESQ